MKRLVLFLALMFVAPFAFSQVYLAPEKHKVVNEINGVTHVEYYAVLHNNERVKTGVWKLINKQGEVIQRVKYRNNKRIWIECPLEDRYYFSEEGRL